MMTSTATDSTRGGSSSLDCILKNTEFENTQQAKAIESEREKIQAYEKQLEEKLRQTRELEESTVSLDEQAKRLHKQFRLNRENYDSLKRTTVVLDEHEEALQRKFKATLLECEEQKAHHEQALSKYADIWTSYHTTYEGSTKAQELQKKCEELQLVDEQNANLEKQIQELNVSLASLQLECDNQGSIVTRVSQMASWRVDTEGNRRAAAASEERAELLLKQVAELEEGVARAEEGVARAEEVLRVQEANKLQDKQAAVMEKELNHQLGTDGMPPGLLPDVNSLSLVVSAVQPPHRLTAPTPPGPGPTPQSLMHLKPTAVQSRVANLFTLPEVPARPASNSASSEKTGTAVGTNSVRLPLAPISLPASKQSTANTTPADQSLGTSRYLLEIPQFSLPARSSTAARNAKASSQSESRGPVLQRQGAASTSVPSISIPARISGSHLLQMPSLQNPSRPQPSTPTLSMAREKAATQLSGPPRQPKPSFQLTVPVSRAQDNIHSPRPSRPQGCTSSGAGEKLGNDSAVEHSVSNGERAVHSLPSILTESQPVPGGEDRNSFTHQTAPNQESGPDEQPDQQYSMEPDQQFSMEPDQQFNMEPDQQYTMEAADQSAEVDAAAYEGYYPSGMQEYMQQYAMYGGQVLEYANNGDMMQIPQGEEADRPGTEPLEGANEFFPSANESTPGGFLYAGFGSAGAAGGFSGGFSFLSESGSQSEGGVGGNQATLPGVSFPLFGGDSPAASTHTQGFSLSFGGGGTSAPAASGFSLF